MRKYIDIFAASAIVAVLIWVYQSRSHNLSLINTPNTSTGVFEGQVASSTLSDHNIATTTVGDIEFQYIDNKFVNRTDNVFSWSTEKGPDLSISFDNYNDVIAVTDPSAPGGPVEYGGTQEEYAQTQDKVWKEQAATLAQYDPVPDDCPSPTFNGYEFRTLSCSIFENENGVRMLVTYTRSPQEAAIFKNYIFFKDSRRYVVRLYGLGTSPEDFEQNLDASGSASDYHALIESIKFVD